MKRITISPATQFVCDITSFNIPNNVHYTISNYFFFNFFGLYSNIINNYI